MNKPKLFVDFDVTLVDSIKKICDVYNILYQDHPDFKPADHTKIQQYNFKDICPLLDTALSIFENELFFKDLKFINHNTYEVLKKLNNKYQLIVVSVGSPKNIAMKANWLVENIPFIKDYILLYNDGCKMDKSVVNMQGLRNYFIDDIPSNLESTNCENKILFGKIYPWNEDGLKNFEHCFNWNEIGERLL
jgi:5'(3')-deoxyribonucleotidase